ncbi:MAG: acyltransferase [Muricauda sp. TMED12]|nr:MAG: acyltransferase [Muricauda sp. TMED12]
MKYRPEIDGLRAISILLVIFFHYGFSAFPGGYIGVDVFFVISGYLIYGITTESQKNSNFSAATFLLRRFRRLAPAYYTTLIACLFASYLVLSPPHFERFSGAYIYSLFGLTNVFLFGETGYFDTSVAFKPLVHLWSLSVEIQFYILFALVLLITTKSTKTPYLLLLTLISFAIALVLHSSNYDYYFTASRLYEFAIGGAAYRCRDWFGKQSQAFNSSAFLIGLVLIFLAATTFTEDTPFPSYHALIPCTGAGLVIASHPSGWLTTPLSWNVSVGLGKISYGLYLVHWPVWVFSNYVLIAEITTLLKLVMIAASILLAWIIYRAIENPFQKNLKIAPRGAGVYLDMKKYRNSSLAGLIIVLISLPVSAVAWNSDGWPWRFDRQLADRIALEMASAKAERKKLLLHPGNIDGTGRKPIPQSRQRERILIVGDSHSEDVFVGFQLAKKDTQDYGIVRVSLDESCFGTSDRAGGFVSRLVYGNARSLNRRPECDSQLVEFERVTMAYKPTVTIVANHWTTSSIAYARNTVRYHKRNSKGTVVLWGNVQLPFHLPTLALVTGGTAELNRKVYGMNRSSQIEVNQFLKDLATSESISYVDVMSAICPPRKTECTVTDDKGQLLFTDNNHFSITGLKQFEAAMLRARDVSAN